MSRIDGVVACGQHTDATVDSRRPVHGSQRHGCAEWEEGHDEGEDEEGQTDGVEDPAPGGTQVPATRQEFFASNALDENAGDGRQVRGEQSDDTDGQNGVESRRATEDDEGEARREDAREQDGVEGNVPARADVTPDASERKAVVTREREHLARGSGDVADGAGEGQESDDARHDRGTGLGARSVVESADEGEVVRRFGGGGEGTQTVRKGDGHDESSDTVETKSPDHGPRQNARGVFNFFGWNGC